MAYDIISNHKICNLRTVAQQTVGAETQLVVDLQEEVTAFLGQRERTTRGLLIIIVTAAASTLDIIVKDSVDGVTYDADFATIDQIDTTGIFVVDLKNITRFIKLYSTAGGNMTWGAVLVGFDAERRPVQQTDTTELDVTYGTGR